MTSGFLVLETGEIFEGRWLGGEDRAGEVVFNTSPSGYEEIATDPSYFSQIVVMTSPQQGNYGVDQSVWESHKLWIEGFICLQMQGTTRDQSWLERLREKKIPCLSQVDTRSLVMHLRQNGTPWGAVVSAKNKNEAFEKAKKLISLKRNMESDWVHLVSRPTKQFRVGQKSQGPTLAVLDFGCKENILRELEARSAGLWVYPSRTPAEEILSQKLDGLILTNGPGDPSSVQVATQTVKYFLGKLPIFGVCMGHQILGLALGAKTFRLKYGHRGANHPIQDHILNRIYMSSQNHGYAVDNKTLPEDVLVSHVNLNDKTCAGIFHEKLKCLSVQFHPESHPGPHDAVGLFDYYIDQMIGKKNESL